MLPFLICVHAEQPPLLLLSLHAYDRASADHALETRMGYPSPSKIDEIAPYFCDADSKELAHIVRHGIHCNELETAGTKTLVLDLKTV